MHDGCLRGVALEPRKHVVAVKARESERTALLYGYLQGANVGLGDCWIFGAGRKVEGGRGGE
eukprot:scaffold32362_cov50-Phaeocystis_antarctica.AAC.1